MTRWSMPSKRPASSSTPGGREPPDEPAGRSGARRGGERKMRGMPWLVRARAVDGRAQHVRAQHHARPAPGLACRRRRGAGRCRRWRMSTVSSCQMPCCRASPASDAASGPGKQLGVQRQDSGPPGRARRACCRCRHGALTLARPGARAGPNRPRCRQRRVQSPPPGRLPR